MIKPILILLMLALLVAGCGVNKDYVSQQIASSEAKTDSKINGVSAKTEANAAEVTRLKGLAQELSDKTDMAINKAAGFENYVILWSGEVNFEYDSYDIGDVAAQTLNEAGEKLEANPGSVIEMAGHTDGTGSQKYNYLLAEKRANSTKRFLAERFGISLYRMFVISYGEDKPVAAADERNANTKNRRVSLSIWGPQQ